MFITFCIRCFSRPFVILVEPVERKKKMGDAKTLEDLAIKASSAFPLIVKSLSEISIKDLEDMEDTIDLESDIRILKGIALQKAVVKKVRIIK